MTDVELNRLNMESLPTDLAALIATARVVRDTPAARMPTANIHDFAIDSAPCTTEGEVVSAFREVLHILSGADVPGQERR
jgi:hypothetical protein